MHAAECVVVVVDVQEAIEWAVVRSVVVSPPVTCNVDKSLGGERHDVGEWGVLAALY